MSSLVSRISALTAAKYGVNILELDPPAGVQASTSRVLGFVAELPWGPTNELVDVNAGGEFFDTFAPLAFDNHDDYDALKALLNKRFGRIKVCRVEAAGAAAATKTFPDDESVPADSVVVTARYKGASGSRIKVAWSANAADPTAMDATVSIGTGYSQTYEAVVAPDGGGGITVTDPGDPYVTFEAAANAVAVPAVASATSLAGGDDGTAVAGDYVGGLASNVGIRKFYGQSVDVAVLMVAEPPADLVDDINSGLRQYGIDTQKGMVVLCGVPAQGKSDAKTYIETYASDRAIYPWPRAKTVNGFDPDRDVIEVDGASWVASVLLQTDPWVSPGGPRRAPFLAGITSLADESATKDDYEDLRAAGACCLAMVRGVGAIIRGAVTTDTTPGRERILRRRMTDYITTALAERWAMDVEEPLDVDLAGQTLGPVTGAQIGDATAWLQGLWEQGRGIATVDGSPGFTLDPFSMNTQGDIDAGRWLVKVSAKLTSTQDEVILAANIGESVQITEV